LTHSWHKSKIGGIIIPEKSRKNTKPSTDLEPQIPKLKTSFDSIDHISTQPTDLGLQLVRKFSFWKWKSCNHKKCLFTERYDGF